VSGGLLATSLILTGMSLWEPLNNWLDKKKRDKSNREIVVAVAEDMKERVVQEIKDGKIDAAVYLEHGATNVDGNIVSRLNLGRSTVHRNGPAAPSFIINLGDFYPNGDILPQISVKLGARSSPLTSLHSRIDIACQNMILKKIVQESYHRRTNQITYFTFALQ